MSHEPRARWAEGGVAPGPHLKVTQMRSAIGAKPKTRGTLRALGLRGPVGSTGSPIVRRSAGCSPGWVIWYASRR